MTPEQNDKELKTIMLLMALVGLLILSLTALVCIYL